MTKILIIEDNEDLAFGLQRTLEFDRYEVEVAGTGSEGLERAGSDDVELVVLDLMLPDLDGFAILRRLREEGSTVPVLVLTARSDESDLLICLDSGADDYVTKPFSTIELLARVRALLRRGSTDRTAATNGPQETFSFGHVEIDARTRVVEKDGTAVALAPKEFDLLLALLRQEGSVVSRADLLDEVWNYANTDVMTRTVDVHVAELRRKLEDDPSNPEYLLTVRKAGYRLKT